MTNHWAIAIGINQYRHFQPLSYAERDAQSFRDFLVREAGFSPKHCLLLTDSSPAIEQTATYPSRDIIQAYIAQLCQKRLQPGDFLWCFFSGYGVRFEGKDYLMPAEGKPDAIAETGIPIEALLDTFAAAPTPNILLTLDVNRSQSVLAGEGVGDQTIALAKNQGLAAILSAQPDQFSHETLALRQGLFTAAVIEGMRYRGCLSLESLVQYLGDRLPELSEHHWRPRQDPFAVIPAERKHQLLVPEAAATTLGRDSLENRLIGAATQTVSSGFAAPMSSASPLSPVAHPPDPYTAASDAALLERSLAAPFPGDPGVPLPATILMPQLKREIAPPAQASRELAQEPIAPAANLSDSERAIDPAIDARFWRRLVTWGGAIAALLLLSVVLRNWRQLTDVPANPGAALEVSPNSGQPSAAIDSASPLRSVQIALESGQYEDARQQLEAMPPEAQDAAYLDLLKQANRGILSEARTILSRSREASAENQASDFADAIAKARQIKLGQPLFEEAHMDIDRWSIVMLDMAQGRADRRNGSSTPLAASNYGAAIASAQLVPNDNPQIYAQAQQAIAQWSQLILDLANERATEGNYDLAIKAAQLIPENTPSYEAAQEAIAQWSTQLY
ncbi:MAG: caspase family protein [Oscillatoriophycideae cyanobacterium NC_groundwater_1537_Pr4_S-0.65um_50_18]|nr:caspase family protein [Oscillatoriophycideae cyanobacterium NC_groundwater_1537_Pr4_S-0.65um_50_18]